MFIKIKQTSKNQFCPLDNTYALDGRPIQSTNM